LGLALGDRRLLREAREFLCFLQQERWVQRLDDVARSGQPGFDDLG